MDAVNDEIFKIESVNREDNRIIANLSVNLNSSIFYGHFPGQPIVPGACMLQVVKEVLNQALSFSLLLKKADHLKFIVMIDPLTNNRLQLDMSYKIADKIIMVTAKLINIDTVCFKFQGSFIRV